MLLGVPLILSWMEFLDRIRFGWRKIFHALRTFCYKVMPFELKKKKHKDNLLMSNGDSIP